MAVTETRPHTPPAPEEAATEAPPATDPVGLERLVGTSDHRTLGRLWIGLSLLLLAVSFVGSALVSVEAVDPDSAEVLGGALTQVATSSLVGLLFLGGFPLVIGLATYVVPLQVGSTSLAHPRAAALAFWTWLLSAGIFVASVILDGGFGGGDDEAVALSITSLGGLLVSLLLATVCLMTTVMSHRPPEMTLARVPVFSFSILVGGAAWLVSMPVALAHLVLAHIGGTGAATGLEAFTAAAGFMLEQPALYLLCVPALGIVAELVPVHARYRQARYGLVLGAVGALAVLSIGGWVTGEAATDTIVWTAMGLAAVLPVLAIAGGVADTLRRGRPQPTSPLGLALAALLMLLVTGGLGALRTIEPLALEQGAAATSQLSYAVGASLIALVAGLFHWAPLIWGRRLSEAVGKLLVLVLLAGVVAWALPDAIGSLLARDGGTNDVADVLAVFTTLGAGLLAGGVLVTLGAVLGAARASALGEGEADPWDGHTLEWAEPPLPVVVGERPLLDVREAEATS